MFSPRQAFPLVRLANAASACFTNHDARTGSRVVAADLSRIAAFRGITISAAVNNLCNAFVAQDSFKLWFHKGNEDEVN